MSPSRTRIAAHEQNIAKGLPAVWLIEIDGSLYEADDWFVEGPVVSMQGPGQWVETRAPVEMGNPRRIS